ncbi:sigma-70 family RNA polymerase sigma factor [Paenibacillus sp. LHD-117]|uniref:sigma-70 family RNA polymerase sigma factor n=1 Tax=Paenibacillus sp. LHD-117 TaxID=3071412 RepID=UPI0027E01182|nr:sigma-70 family RNA polymerase sigma factor [Paenibacillus sp. LHD-117]MDQ6420995.1 sigma-70 family RNA polymerase sigma factor [Paenibacillus sp. LHD-117]
MKETYTLYRPLLLTLAYRMLGSLSEAEDIVQDTLADYYMADRDDIAHEKAYLVRMVTNRCLNLKQSARKRREVYVGEWLPEPAVQYAGAALPQGDMNPANVVERQENITYVMLVMLERLSAVERAVFLLRETLDFDYGEIAGIVQKSEANCRKIFSRAKEKLGDVSAGMPSPMEGEGTVSDSEAGMAAVPDERVSGAGTASSEAPGDTARQRAEKAWAIAQAFMRAAETGNSAALIGMLAEDAVLVSDGGGKVRAAIFPIVGSERIAAFFEGIARKGTLGETFLPAVVSGQPGLVAMTGGRPSKVLTFGWDADGRLSRIFIILNPDKLVSVTNGRPALS